MILISVLKYYDGSLPCLHVTSKALKTAREKEWTRFYDTARPFHQAIAPSTKTTTMASLTIVV
jgi:hypothetical protein